MVVCLERGADLHMARLMPLLLTVSCSSGIQIGFAFLVPAYPGCPGKEADKTVVVHIRPLQNFLCMLPMADRWGTCVVICLERGADLHMAQRMPLSLASVKSSLVLPFWYSGSPRQRAVKRVCVCVTYGCSSVFLW